MATLATSTTAPTDHRAVAQTLPVEPVLSPTAVAIAAHVQAYEASVAALDRVQALRLEFDPDLAIEDELGISRAIVARYGYRFREAGEAYRDAEAASTAAAESEDSTWLAFLRLRPTTADEVHLWLAHVVQHSAREDEVVNLREALGLACGWLAERLPQAA